MRMSVLLLGLAACGSNAAPSLNGRVPAQALAGVPGLANFARLTPQLYRGAQPSEEGLRELKRLGIKTVVSLRSWHSAKAWIEAAGLKAVELPLHADVFGSTPPTEEDLARFFGVILDPEAQPVYFHCAHGKDRTGTMAAVYRMEVEGWSAEEAIAEMQHFGYHDIYRDLIGFIRSYTPRGYARRPR